MIELCAFSDEASLELSGQIAALQRNRIAYTELRSVGKKNIKDLTEKETVEIKKELDDGGISVWSIGSPLGKVDISVNIDEYLETVKHVCTLANILDTDKIRAFSFFKAYDFPHQVFEYMKKMSEVAKTFGVKLYHENEKEIFGDTAERVLKIMSALKDWGYVYDPANFLQVGEKAEDTLNKILPRCNYFHIKDVISTTGELVPAGYGDGKIDKLISSIHSDKVLTIEPHLALFEAYKSIDGTEMKHKFDFKNADDAFDAAVQALKNTLIKCKYKEIQGEIGKWKLD